MWWEELRRQSELNILKVFFFFTFLLDAAFRCWNFTFNGALIWHFVNFYQQSVQYHECPQGESVWKCAQLFTFWNYCQAERLFMLQQCFYSNVSILDRDYRSALPSCVALVCMELCCYIKIPFEFAEHWMWTCKSWFHSLICVTWVSVFKSVSEPTGS